MRSATVVPAACSLEPDSVAQTVVHGAESAERRLEALTAWERVVRQAGESIETLGLAAQCFGDHFACDVGVGDAVTAAALRVIDVASQPPDLRQARQREQEVARPGVVDFHIRQLWECF